MLAPAAGAAVLLMLYAMLNRHAFIHSCYAEPYLIQTVGYENSEHTFVRLTWPDNAAGEVVENRGYPGSCFFSIAPC